MRIWKWPLQARVTQTIEIPHGARILSVQAQNNVPILWALVDESAYVDRRAVMLYGTGAAIPDEPGEYIGTFQLYGGALVLHAFAEKSVVTDAKDV